MTMTKRCGITKIGDTSALPKQNICAIFIAVENLRMMEPMDMKRRYGDIRDEVVYKDEGCQLSASCLACPFERCLEEVPRGRQRHVKQSRAKEMRRLYQCGKGSHEIARIFSVSQRTVQRAVADSRRAVPAGGAAGDI